MQGNGNAFKTESHNKYHSSTDLEESPSPTSIGKGKHLIFKFIRDLRTKSGLFFGFRGPINKLWHTSKFSERNKDLI